MSIAITRKPLFQNYQGIRYLTGLDSYFFPNSYSGRLLFYKGNPSKVVNIEVFRGTRELEESDITVTLGTYHSPDNFEDEVKDKKDMIYEICKNYDKNEFVMDLENFDILTEESFTSALPHRGLHSLFTFENIKTKNGIFCLVNASTRVHDGEVYSWFLSYIYSGRVCLTPKDDATKSSKIFMQAVSTLIVFGGNKEKIFIMGDNATDNFGYSDTGEVIITAPGKCDRLAELWNKAVLEMYPETSKK